MLKDTILVHTVARDEARIVKQDTRHKHIFNQFKDSFLSVRNREMNSTTATALAVVASVWAIYLLLSALILWRLGIVWFAVLVGGATWFLAPYLRMTLTLASLALMADRMTALLDKQHPSSESARQNVTGV